MRPEMWVVLVAVVGVVLTRSVYRLLNPQWTNTDAFAHFNIAREIRRNGHKPPEDHSGTFHPGRFTYPPTVHVLLSFLPERYYETVDRLFSPAVDLLFAGLLLALVPVGLLDIGGVAVALTLFVATPQFVRPDHPHGVGLSSRKPGLLLFSVGTVAFLTWVTASDVGALAIALAAGTLLALTSRFSTQAFLFVALALGTFHTPVAVAYFAASLVLAVIVSSGYYWRVLSAHVWFALDFAREKQYKFLYDGLKSIHTLRRFLTAIRNRSPREALEGLFDSILLRSLFDSPFVVPAVVAVLVGDPNTVPPGYLVWFYAGLGAFVLTSLYHLRFLGHAGRYLEHAFVPGVVIIASAFEEFGAPYAWLVYATAFGGLATIGAYVFVQAGWTDQSEREAFASLVEQLGNLPPGRVLIQPRYGGAEVAWKTDHAVNDFLGTGFDTLDAVADRNLLYPEREGWVTDDTAWLAAEFDPDWIVFDREVAENAPQNALSEPEREPLWVSDTYALYEFES